ncbi:putative DNA-binding pseudobarrel domain superfamily, REM family [Helianthus debilis subsp. tardiflorus]
MARVYVGERFWNVKMEGWSDCCCFIDEWLKVVEEVPLKNELYLVFTRINSKTFEIYVFDPAEVFFKKVDVDKGKSKVDAGRV